MTTHILYNCTQCDYTSKRKYNLERHINTMHTCSKQLECINVDTICINTDTTCINVDTNDITIDTNDINVDTQGTHRIKCPDCYKTFKCGRNLQLHIPKCSKRTFRFQCRECMQILGSSSALCHHRRFCKGKSSDNENITKDCNIVTQATAQEQPSHISNTTNHIQAHAVQNANTINNHNTYILGFPDECDPDFKYVKDHINHPQLEKYWKGRRPEIGFRMYANAILERRENRNIYKSNPNTKYCKVLRDDQWEMELDKDAMPIVTNQLSIAALEDVHQYREKIKRTRIDVATILRYLEDINTENDENDNYKDAEDRIRLIIINMSQRWGLPTLEV